jgi:hypothetical protein
MDSVSFIPNPDVEMPLSIRCSAIVLTLIVATSCSEAGSDPQGDETTTAGLAEAESPPEEVALTCEAGPLYTALGEWVLAYQPILRRPQLDAYETDAQFAPRLAAWEQWAATAVDSALTTAEPITFRQEVRSFSYDSAAEMLVIEDFGPLVVPGVVVDPALRLPYPSIHCATGPFLRCATHATADSWRTEVVANHVALQTTPEARIGVPRQLAESSGLAAGPVEYEMTFALVADVQNQLLPVAQLTSLRFFVGDQEIANWQGEATPAGRTTEQRLIAFVPEPVPACP